MTDLKDAFDWDGVRSDMSGILKNSFGDLIEGAGDDVDRFYDLIAADMTRAMVDGNDAIIGELQDQLLLIAETNRVRFVRESKEVAVRGFGMALRTVGGVLKRLLL